MIPERILDNRYNHHILKYFNSEIVNKYSKFVGGDLIVALSLQYVKLKRIFYNKKIRVHIHPKTDLDQRLSLYYICKFLNISRDDLDIIEWPELSVMETQEYDLVVDIMVSKDFNHKNILVFDHHNNESKNTLEQLKRTINPSIPDNLIYYTDSSHVKESDIFEPQNIFFLKDFDDERVINIFQEKMEYECIDKFKDKDLYRKWKERKRKSLKTLNILKDQFIDTKFGKVMLTFDNMYNASLMSLYYLNCDYFINIRAISVNSTKIVIMTKEGNEVSNEIIEWVSSLSDDVYIYSDRSMVMVGSLYSDYKYIHMPWNNVVRSLFEALGITHYYDVEGLCQRLA